jgi:hypothetical protein
MFLDIKTWIIRNKYYTTNTKYLYPVKAKIEEGKYKNGIYYFLFSGKICTRHNRMKKIERMFKYHIQLQGDVQNITENEEWGYPIHVTGKS